MTDTVLASRAPDELAHSQTEQSTGQPVDQPDDQPDRQIADLARSLAAEAGCALYDVNWRGGTLVVSASAVGGGSPDIDALGKLSRRLSAELDAADLVAGRYVLEVSSPGLERKLLCPEHFAAAVGERAVLTTSGPDRRRITGEVLSSDDSSVSLRVEKFECLSAKPNRTDAPDPNSEPTITVPFADIGKARTTFEWGAGPTKHAHSSGTQRGTATPTARKQR